MREHYNTTDSGLMFILALIMPSIFVLVLSPIIKAIFPNMSETASYYVLLTLNQVGFFLTFFVYNKKRKINMWQACKVKANLNVLQIIIIIALGLIAMFGFSSLVNYMEWGLSKIGYTYEAFNFLDLSNFGMLIVNIILVALLPAICEELVFRGTILNGLKKFGPRLMMVLCGLLFAIMHLNIEQSIYQFVLGMVLAGVVLVTGSILSSMILHFFNNALVLVMSFITPQTEEALTWAPTCAWDHIQPFLFAIISLAIIFGLILALQKCSKNGEYKLFNFKKQSKQTLNANIDIVNEQAEMLDVTQDSQDALQQSQPSELNGTTANKKNSSDIVLWISIGFGVILWIATILGQILK